MSQNGEIIVGSEGSFEMKLPDEGQHLVYCYGIVVIGNVPGYQDQYQDKVMFLFETPNAKAVFNEDIGPQPFGFSKEFTKSLDKRANLRKWIDSWRGKPLTDHEAVAFNIVAMMDVPIVANIYHKEAKNGKVYTEVSSIAPFRPQQGFKFPPRGNQKLIFTWNPPFDPATFLRIPLWIRNKMIRSTEFVNLGIQIPMLQEEAWDNDLDKVIKKPKVQTPASQQSQNQMADNAFAPQPEAPQTNIPQAQPIQQQQQQQHAPAPQQGNFNIPGNDQRGSEDSPSSGFRIP